MKTQKLLLVISFLLLYSLIKAQNSYRFEQTTANYTELQGATVIANPQYGSSALHNISLDGETFKLYNLLFTFGGSTLLSMQPNGNLRIDNDSSIIIVDAAFTYLDSIDNTTSLSYKIEGTSGDYIVKTQWKNLKIRARQAANYTNFQIWIYQKSGVIENHYGPSTTNNQIGFNTSTGPHAGMFYSPNNVSKIYEKLWLNGHYSSLKFDSTTKVSFDAMQGVPPEGTVYRFVPRFSTLSVAPPPLKENLSIYPNPASNVLSFSQEITGVLFDAMGRQILAFNKANQLDINHLPIGIYTIQLENGMTYKASKQ